jgi:hypothetical protein
MNGDPMMKPAGQVNDSAAPLFNPPADATVVAAAAAAAGPHPDALPRPVKCAKCEIPIYFMRNRATTRSGPVDARSTIYVVDLAATGTNAAGEPVFEGWTKRDFLEQAAEVVMKDGRRIPANLLEFGVSHYATCSSPEFFSKNGGYRKPQGPPRGNR